MSIFPLPQFEADIEADKAAYEALKPPTSIVVRFGLMRMIGEYPYDGQAKPGCGSKLVCRTHRGTELAEMLTTTCTNSGCGKSVSRKEMLDYVENSGGRDYPFFGEGRVLRVATVDDMNRQATLDAQRPEMLRRAREVQQRVGPHNIKVVDVEPLLGGERLIFHFLCEERVDFRPLMMELANLHRTRIDMHQVGARDEARLTADYERCGQHCCCRQFLKVLKPVSMKSAKTQKATLDPLKISGRCGRLMCCLRYEDSTYDELKKNLPKKKVAVTTPDGTGIVMDTQILTQLVLVRLDATGEEAAYPVENLSKIGTTPVQLPPPGAERGPARGPGPGAGHGQGSGQGPRPDARGQREGGRPERGPRPDRPPQGPAAHAPGGAPRPPLTEEERARKRQQKLIPRSEFREGAPPPQAAPGQHPAPPIPPVPPAPGASEAGGADARDGA